MTASEVRDRLDHRFRLLVGSRRGLKRHHTLRHAVAWSYDLLDDAEKDLLDRCSVFAGGFDLQSACAVAGFDDDYAVLDLLDALVRKSLLVADRSAGRTRFSMLETIRQFAEEQLVASGEATEVRTAHARYFAGREADILALWDSPRQREAYDVVHRRAGQSAHRVSVGRRPWRSRRRRRHRNVCGIPRLLRRELRADRLGRRADRTRPRRRPSPARVPVRDGVAVLGSRTDRGGRPATATPGQTAMRSGRGEVPFGFEGMLGGAYTGHRPARTVRSSGAAPSSHAVATPTHSPGQHWCIALTIAGCSDEAMAAANGLIDTAEATRNPYALSFALMRLRLRLPRRRSRPRSRGHAPGSGDRSRQRQPRHRDPSGGQSGPTRSQTTATRWPRSITSLVAIRNYHDAGNTANMRAALAALAAVSRSARTPRSGGHHRRFRAQSPHRSVRFPRSTPRSPTCAMSSATRPTNRSPARARR